MKSVRIRTFQGSYFPAFELNTVMLLISPILIRLRENTAQKNSQHGHFSCSECRKLPQQIGTLAWNVLKNIYDSGHIHISWIKINPGPESSWNEIVCVQIVFLFTERFFFYFFFSFFFFLRFYGANNKHVRSSMEVDGTCIALISALPTKKCKLMKI